MGASIRLVTFSPLMNHPQSQTALKERSGLSTINLLAAELSGAQPITIFRASMKTQRLSNAMAQTMALATPRRLLITTLKDQSHSVAMQQAYVNRKFLDMVIGIYQQYVS